ncbi:MAG: hypothetical protein JSW66_15180 [Phycisphaerales bacterium]|nr:MAG: hypothetical protein JSW66_15180 [Phycisphaerales bacterium]
MSAKRTAKTRAKRKTSEPKKLPVKQRDYQVGDKKPPKEHQFKPGESGNPKGPPKHRTQLWTYFCKYMALTDTELAKLDRKKLTQAQQTALKLVKNAKAGQYSGSERLARYAIDREEGKAVEHLIIDNENVLTDQECEQIREELLKHHAD